MLLQTEQLTKNYGNFTALADLNLNVRAGEVFGLLGPNGSGKTTALRVAMGFLRPTSGRAAIDGHDCWHDGVRARRNVAYLPGELRLYENMTGRQLVRFLCRLRGQPVQEDIPRLAARLEIDLDRPIAALSSGMKRKLALLQVLAPKVPLLILDEPTNTLDPTMRDELLALLSSARAQGQAVLFSSHVLAEVEQICDRVGILRNGRLVHVQDMHELRQARLIRARWDGASPGPPGSSEGLQVRFEDAHSLTIECQGPLAPVLQWLAAHPPADLRVEPLGLSAIYYRHHQASA